MPVSQQHFEMVARILRESRDERRDEHDALLNSLAYRFASEFAKSNPKFKRGRFLLAAGVTLDVTAAGSSADIRAALANLLEQVYEMEGIFTDEDHTINDAIYDAEMALHGKSERKPFETEPDTLASRCSADEYQDGRLINGFDYERQAWVQNGRYIPCGHPESMKCDCYGRRHAGEETTKPDAFDEVNAIMAYESGCLNEDDVLELFQHLVDNGHVWQLQGHYGRTAVTLISAGLIQPAQ